ncbi:MAG TPA: acyl-CoA dehydrogenase family protein [Blastocatellia bacterium]|jgi:alkylation response protein AidB-like acyl-CoA dehydrogenase
MDFELNDTQKLFQRSAREFFAQECPPALVREMIENGDPYSRDLWAKLVEQGWTGLIFAEEHGGQGLGHVEMAVGFEEMGRALFPGAYLSTVALSGSLLSQVASEANSHKHLEAICGGQAQATLALLEESASWDAGQVALTATETGDGLRLSGKKLFVADAETADIILVAARAGGELVIAAIPRTRDGVSIKLMPSLDQTRHLYEVSFSDAEINNADVIARGDAARRALEHALDVAALAASAEMVGGMQWILEATVEYAKTRKQFGKPIGSFQAVQHHCANILLMTESARSAVYYAAWVMGNDPEQAPLAVSIAKTYCSDAYREVGNLGIQVHGGIGFTWDENIHFYYKRAKASELMFGDATYHRERIARIIIDRASKPVLAAGQHGD